uniref:Uncharacterized protein n=1 Tax=Arundo donax TaxID=35708 RepID=A0A0A9BFS1_ARUDO
MCGHWIVFIHPSVSYSIKNSSHIDRSLL